MFNALLIFFMIMLQSCIYAYAGFNMTKIYCPLTKKHLYTYIGDIEKISSSTEKDFLMVGTDKFVNKNGELVCPYDGSYLNGYLYWFQSKNYSLPKMAYPAVTIMTKDKNGKFVWVPYALNLENN